MEENPYRSPVDRMPTGATPAWRKFGWAIGAGVGVALVAVSRIDVRENPRYWDEVERRMKAGMTEKEAAESAHVWIEENIWPRENRGGVE